MVLYLVNIVVVLFIMFSCDVFVGFFFFKQKTAYEMRISDWSSDVCSSDLGCGHTTTTFRYRNRPITSAIGKQSRHAGISRRSRCRAFAPGLTPISWIAPPRFPIAAHWQWQQHVARLCLNASHG